jgi:hypothetical protein
MTLCERCLDVFLSDDRYVVTPVYTAACEKGDCECFICCGRGRDYDIVKLPKKLAEGLEYGDYRNQPATTYQV